MDETGETVNPTLKRENIRATQFDAALLELSRIPWSYDRFPRQIEVGSSWSQRMRELLAETLAHPEKLEHGRYAVARKGSLVYLDKSIVGEKTATGQKLSGDVDLYQRAHIANVNGELRQYSEMDSLVIRLHTHGDQHNPPSPADFGALLADDSQLIAPAVEAVITPSIQFMLCKTLQTPQLPVEKIKTNTQKWKDLLFEKYRAYGTNHHAGEAIKAYEHRMNLEAMQKIAAATKVRVYTSTNFSEFMLLE